MSDFTVLLARRGWEWRNRFLAVARRGKFRALLIAGTAVLLWFGLYVMFWKGFLFMERELLGLAESSVLSLLGLFFFALTVLLIFSNALVSYASLFRSDETRFLLTQPVGWEGLFAYKFGEALAFSSWAFLFLGTPLLAAYGRYVGASWEFYPLVLATLTAFVFIPAALGTLASLFVGAFLPRSRRAVILTLVLFLVAVAAVIVTDLWTYRVSTGNVTVALAQGMLDRFRFLQHPLLPSRWVQQIIAMAGQQEYEGVWFYGALILSNALFLSTFAVRMARVLYPKGWYLQGRGHRKRRRPPGRLREKMLNVLFLPLGSRMRELVVKDVKTFFRDPSQWSQFLIFFGLLGIYFVNLRTLAYDVKGPWWQQLVAHLNLGATCMTLATFQSRFIFPQMSLEGRHFWVLGVAPLQRGMLLAGKFLWAFVGSAITSVSLILLSAVMLRVNAEMIRYQVAQVLFVCFGLTGLSVGLGARYADFREDNPSKIVSGFGGTLNLFACLFFVAGAFVIEVIPSLREGWGTLIASSPSGVPVEGLEEVAAPVAESGRGGEIVLREAGWALFASAVWALAFAGGAMASGWRHLRKSDL